jgi:hypothetical protein
MVAAVLLKVGLPLDKMAVLVVLAVEMVVVLVLEHQVRDQQVGLE